MESLEQLRGRVETAERLHSIVKTMQVLAAAGIRRYEGAAASLADYDRTVRLGLQALLRSVPTMGPRSGSGMEVDAEWMVGEKGAVLGVAFGTDQGLCGQLNERVTERTMDLIGRMPAPTTLVASGERLASLLEDRGLEPAERLGTPGSLDGVVDAVSQILPIIARHRQGFHTIAVYLIFPYRTSPATYAVRLRRVLPLDRRWINVLRARPWPSRCVPSWPGDRQATLAALIREYLFVSLFRAQVDTLASEHTSRLSSMQAADRNIEERLETWQGQYRGRRQAAITNELMDVISGFESLVERNDS